MEDHHWGGQGWNSAVEPEEDEDCDCFSTLIFCVNPPMFLSIACGQKKQGQYTSKYGAKNV
jgi:hypothetical protein